MAQKTEIQYVNQFYVFGSEAPKTAAKAARPKRAKAPSAHLAPIQTIYIDPVALCGVVAAVVMLCLLIAGAYRLRDTRVAYDQAKTQLVELKRENAQLSHTYHTSFDLEEIRTQAEAAGMVPKEDAAGFTVFFSVPEKQEEQTVWDDFVWALSWLFSKSEDYVLAEE